jgi:S1-C subfamily serine protease
MEKKMIKNLINKLITTLEASVGLFTKVSVALVFIGLAGLAFYLANKTDTNITSATVMITNVGQSSGGSGVVIYNDDNESSVLTNRHVCELLKDGGSVSLVNGQSHLVSKYVMSNIHDLCLVGVQANLGHSAKVANRSPKIYEKATVSGHPNLLPNVVSTGHFSGNKVIRVLTGFKECTKADLKDPQLGILCIIFGKLPVLKTYETVLATAMIMPGSSGSAVYNEDFEISGLVFAGSGEMSYAFTVPYTYVHEFLNKEIPKLKVNVPNYTLDVRSLIQESGKKKSIQEIVNACRNSTSEFVKNHCAVVIRDLTFRRQDALWN